METEIFTIADSAAMYEGKLSMLGSFDCLNAHSFPTRHSACVVICKLRLTDEDSGDHFVRLRIIDPDGVDVIPPAEGSFQAQIGIGSTAHHTHLWHIHGFPLPRPGTFYIDLVVDGSLMARTPLYVRKV